VRRSYRDKIIKNLLLPLISRRKRLLNHRQGTSRFINWFGDTYDGRLLCLGLFATPAFPFFPDLLLDCIEGEPSCKKSPSTAN